MQATEPGGVAAPTAVEASFMWQGKRQIAANLYYSRTRIWSADLGAFLQPDEYGYLSRGGTLWSWPGQNPFRWRDPSGRLAEDGFFLRRVAGEAGAAAGEAGPLGELALIDALMISNYLDQVDALGAEIFAQQDANLNAIARAATRDNEGKANPGAQCKTENSGGGAKGPPAAKSDVGADDEDEGPRSLADILSESTPGGMSKPGMGSDKFSKPGGIDAANSDFEALTRGQSIDTTPSGVRTSDLKPGRRIYNLGTSIKHPGVADDTGEPTGRKSDQDPVLLVQDQVGGSIT